MKRKGCIRSICANIGFGVLAILFLILFCVFLITVIAPFWLYRWIVTKIAIHCGSGIYKILDPASQLILNGPIQNEQRSNVTLSAKIGGKLNSKELKEKIIQIFLHSKFDDGKLCYPEFKMFPEYWLGYPFWKSQTDFKIEEHIRTEQIPGNGTSAAEDEEAKFVFDYEIKLLKIPFVPGRSPWEILYLEGGNNSYLIFKAHHSLCDGQAMFQILMQVVDNYQPFNLPVKVRQGGKFAKFRKFLAFPFCVAFECAKVTKSVTDSSTTPWSLKTKDMSKETRTIVGSNEGFNVDDIKMAGLKHGVSFTAVLMTAISVGVHNIMNKTNPDLKMHPNLITGFPVPNPSHPGTLTNSCYILPIKIPIGKSDRATRLQYIAKKIQKAKKSPFPIAHVFVAGLSAVFPHCILSRLTAEDSFVLGIANFPGPRLPVTLQGLPVLDIDFHLLQTTFTSVQLTMCSYNGRMRLTCCADPKIFPTNELAQEFLAEIDNEMTALISTD